MTNSNGSSSSANKLALIIGNGEYSNPSNRLNHSINNANDLSVALEEINFKVTTEINLKENEMMSKINDFSKQLNDGDFVFFYYSGHACHINKENYLIPVDYNDIENNENISDCSALLRNAFGRLAEKKPSHIICILDCCRPYKLGDGSILKGE